MILTNFNYYYICIIPLFGIVTNLYKFYTHCLVKERPLPQYTSFYVPVELPDDGRNMS
jgi:hypothetical protein